jgi:hypothetical protein
MRPERALGQDSFLKGHGWMRNKWVLIAIAALALLVALNMTHKYGPYYGKVVDAETGEPIEKAVVAVWFETESISLGGAVYHVEDALETLTDANGEFRIPAKRLYKYKMFSTWDDSCVVSIYMPGYGAYPWSRKANNSLKEKASPPLPEKEYVTYYIPKILTIEDMRKDFLLTPGGNADEKLPILMKYIDEREKMVYRMQMEKNK